MQRFWDRRDHEAEERARIAREKATDETFEWMKNKIKSIFTWN